MVSRDSIMTIWPAIPSILIDTNLSDVRRQMQLSASMIWMRVFEKWWHTLGKSVSLILHTVEPC